MRNRRHHNQYRGQSHHLEVIDVRPLKMRESQLPVPYDLLDYVVPRKILTDYSRPLVHRANHGDQRILLVLYYSYYILYYDTVYLTVNIVNTISIWPYRSKWAVQILYMDIIFLLYIILNKICVTIVTFTYII